MRLNAKQNILANIGLSAGLTKRQSEQIHAPGKEAVVFALLQLAQRTELSNTEPHAVLTAEARRYSKAGVLHGGETGWRVNGKTHWLQRRCGIITAVKKER